VDAGQEEGGWQISHRSPSGQSWKPLETASSTAARISSRTAKSAGGLLTSGRKIRMSDVCTSACHAAQRCFLKAFYCRKSKSLPGRAREGFSSRAENGGRD
jgi:hypothetical protein